MGGARQEKPVVFLGDAREAIRAFPDEARRAAGYQIGRVQQGNDPDDWKPLTSIGPNVREIRVRDSAGAFRVIYQANLSDAVLVLNAFQKKTQKTPQHEIEKARARLNEYLKRGSK